MKHLTVRRVPNDVAEALEREKQRRGESLNQTVIDLLRRALGLGPERHDNGLGKYAGAWSEEEFESFESDAAELDVVDEELWS